MTYNYSPQAFQPGKTAVYWLYCERGALLCVGISKNPRERWKQHVVDKSWWGDVVGKEVEWFESVAEALDVEARRIKKHMPLHNRAGTKAYAGQISTLKRIGLMRAQDSLGRIVDAVAQSGTPVVITRNNQPLVILSPYPND